MNAADLKRDKRRIRRRILELRDALPAERRVELGSAIVERFLGVPEVRGARSVMVFWSFGSEIDTAPLLERLHERGVTIALPKIRGREIVAIPYRPGDATASTSFGAREPVGDAELPARELDVVAVPAVAFDRRGHRLGYGAGYYDRFLPTTPATSIGVAFGVQVLDEDLPVGAGDVAVDALVTERATIRFRELNRRSTTW